MARPLLLPRSRRVSSELTRVPVVAPCRILLHVGEPLDDRASPIRCLGFSSGWRRGWEGHAHERRRRAPRCAAESRLFVAFGAAGGADRHCRIQAACSTRWRSRSNLARPYILLLISLSRLTLPSTCP